MRLTREVIGWIIAMVMHAGDRLIVITNARKRKPKYRDAFMEEFIGVPIRRDEVALWVEALITELIRTRMRHGRAGW